jgi:hypothetical protein
MKVKILEIHEGDAYYPNKELIGQIREVNPEKFRRWSKTEWWHGDCGDKYFWRVRVTLINTNVKQLIEELVDELKG